MGERQLVLGIDFGTDSVRALLVDTVTGEEVDIEVTPYRRWSEGRFCDPPGNQFRQHPLDHIEGMESSVRGVLEKLGPESGGDVAGIGVDTTGSTPCLVDRGGRPLAMTDEFSENPNAMFILWKDHTAIEEAEEINHTSRSWGGPDYTIYSGGSYSSEWFWSKILHALRNDPDVRAAAHSAVEHCDWIPALLTGTDTSRLMKRSRCAAGHKAMWHADWDGLPAEEFWVKVDPLLEGFRAQLYSDTFTSDTAAGSLTDEWAGRLGLAPGIPVAVGALDAHMGAVGSGIRPKILSKIIGTSTCDMMVAPREVVGEKLVEGISGQVDGSILPGMIGLEAGQSAFGDVYDWFRRLLAWPLETVVPETGLVDKETAGRIREETSRRILQKLSEEASGLDPEDTGLVALDWLNGRRNPDADYSLKGAIAGIKLGTSAAEFFRALVEATAFGSRAIMERLKGYGVEIEEVVATGGIPHKSPFVIQMLTDILGVPINICRSEQATALGSAMFAAVVAGIAESVETAQEIMGSGFSRTYSPDRGIAGRYDELYDGYLRLGSSLEDQLRQL